MSFYKIGLAALLAALLTACGGSVVQSTTDGSGGGGAGDAGGGGSGGGIGGNGGGTSSGGNGGGDSCSDYDDQKVGKGTVTFHFQNQSPFPIYLRGSCADVEYSITPQDGADQLQYAYDHSCLQTCHDRQTEPQFECGACAPSAIRVDPGKPYDVTWDGTALATGVVMPAQCYDEQSDSSCSEVRAAAVQSYAVSATIFSNCDNCTCMADGTCSGFPGGQTAMTEPTTFVFPSQTSVDVPINDCVFGCP